MPLWVFILAFLDGWLCKRTVIINNQNIILFLSKWMMCLFFIPKKVEIQNSNVSTEIYRSINTLKLTKTLKYWHVLTIYEKYIKNSCFWLLIIKYRIWILFHPLLSPCYCILPYNLYILPSTSCCLFSCSFSLWPCTNTSLGNLVSLWVIIQI